MISLLGGWGIPPIHTCCFDCFQVINSYSLCLREAVHSLFWCVLTLFNQMKWAHSTGFKHGNYQGIKCKTKRHQMQKSRKRKPELDKTSKIQRFRGQHTTKGASRSLRQPSPLDLRVHSRWNFCFRPSSSFKVPWSFARSGPNALRNISKCQFERLNLWFGDAVLSYYSSVKNPHSLSWLSSLPLHDRNLAFNENCHTDSSWKFAASKIREKKAVLSIVYSSPLNSNGHGQLTYRLPILNLKAWKT